MTYEITVGEEVANWDSYIIWSGDYSAPVYFTKYLKSEFPDCILDAKTVDRVPGHVFWAIDITFKSEAHYTWFLLQQ